MFKVPEKLLSFEERMKNGRKPTFESFTAWLNITDENGEYIWIEFLSQTLSLGIKNITCSIYLACSIYELPHFTPQDPFINSYHHHESLAAFILEFDRGLPS